MTALRLSTLSQWRPTPSNLQSHADHPIPFPSTPTPTIFSAALDLARSAGTVQLSPFPRLTSFLIRQLPYMRRAKAVKDAYIRAAIDACLALMSNETVNHHNRNSNGNNKSNKDGGNNSSNKNDDTVPFIPTTALQSVLLRERTLALKASRPPSYHSQAIYDEFLGLILAAHDTTATTMAWGVKYLTNHPPVQDRLRRDLRAAMPHAVASGQTPSQADLLGINVPYLDAVVWEVLRCRSPIGLILRRALVDTTVLGRRVPKGTDVFFMTDGPGFLTENMEVADEERSPGARKGGRGNSGGWTGMWEDEGIADFKPERWLKVGDDGEEWFDAAAGPAIPFGLGPRGCYGKRLALMQLKFQFALFVWHFYLLKLPDELNGFGVVQNIAREPTQCYVRLAAVDS